MILKKNVFYGVPVVIKMTYQHCRVNTVLHHVTNAYFSLFKMANGELSKGRKKSHDNSYFKSYNSLKSTETIPYQSCVKSINVNATELKYFDVASLDESRFGEWTALRDHCLCWCDNQHVKNNCIITVYLDCCIALNNYYTVKIIL